VTAVRIKKWAKQENNNEKSDATEKML